MLMCILTETKYYFDYKNVLSYILFGKSAYFWKETGVGERDA